MDTKNHQGYPTAAVSEKRTRGLLSFRSYNICNTFGPLQGILHGIPPYNQLTRPLYADHRYTLDDDDGSPASICNAPSNQKESSSSETGKRKKLNPKQTKLLKRAASEQNDSSLPIVTKAPLKSVAQEETNSKTKNKNKKKQRKNANKKRKQDNKSTQPPNKRPRFPTEIADRTPIDVSVDKSLHNGDKNNTDSKVFLAGFKEVSVKYSSKTAIYTDASGNYSGAVGAAAVQPGVTKLSQTLPADTTVFMAEIHAIYLSLKIIQDHKDHEFVIYSDCMNAIDTIKSIYTFNEYILHIQADLRELLKSKCITLCWVPSHVGIAGNDLADAEAKAAAYRKVDADLNASTFMCI